MSRRASVADALRARAEAAETTAKAGGRGVLDPETLRAAAKQDRADAERVSRPRGRPRLASREESRQITVRVTADQIAKLDDLAHAGERTSDTVRRLIEEA